MKLHHVFFFILFSSTSAFSTTKFVEWFPQSLTKLRAAWRGPCKPIYDDFVYRSQGQCGPVLDCLLEYGTSELRKTTIAAAQVTLGLIPTLLSCVGNSVPEISLLASQRPTLTMLLTLGAPGMYPARFTQYVNPFDVLDEAASKQIFSGARAATKRTVIISSQYLLAMAIAANNLEMSLRLGSRSVLAWGCRSWYMPMVWVLFSMSTYAFATMSCFIAKGNARPTYGSMKSRWMRLDPIEDTLSSSLRSLQVYMHIQTLVRGEEPSIPVMIWQVCASCLAVVHTILGTLILSSLIFVGFHDTIVILARFLASALVSRMIVLFQLDLIRDQFDQTSIVDRDRRSFEQSTHSADVSLEQIEGSIESSRPARPAGAV